MISCIEKSLFLYRKKPQSQRPASACDLVARMLIVEPAERATLAQVLAHEWVGSVP